MPEEENARWLRLAQNGHLFETRRLQLVPFELDLIKAVLESREKLSELLAVRVPPDWPGEDFAEVLPSLAFQMEAASARFAWNWLIVHKQERTIIGDVG